MSVYVIMHENDDLSVWGICSTREKAESVIRYVTTEQHYGEYYINKWDLLDDDAYIDLNTESKDTPS